MPGWEWVRRFDTEGLTGLEHDLRPGHSRTHDETVRSALIGLVTQKPDTQEYPFKLWTLQRLQSAFNERRGVHLSASTIWT